MNEILIENKIRQFVYSLHPKWEFSHIGLPVKKIYDLRMHFLDLIRNDKTTNWSLQCQKVLQRRHAPLCQHLLKKGQTPTQYRGAFWSYVLGSHVEQHVRWMPNIINSITHLLCSIRIRTIGIN